MERDREEPIRIPYPPPSVKWDLNRNDRLMLRSLRIKADDELEDDGSKDREDAGQK